MQNSSFTESNFTKTEELDKLNLKEREPEEFIADMALPWQEASSLIIVSKTPLGEVVGKRLDSIVGAAVGIPNTFESQTHDCGYKLLMVKRSGRSSYMANAFVFPGGIIEPSDFTSQWWKAFEKVGASRDLLITQLCEVKGPRPPMIKAPNTLERFGLDRDDCLPADIAFRIAAIRETFEETGVLLVTAVAKTQPTSASCVKHDSSYLDLSHWRKMLRKDPKNFVQLCLESNVCPDVWGLYEWWDWLTPTSVGHRRYDTMFYLCCLDKQPSDVVLNRSEVITLKWGTPLSFLDDFSCSKIFLAPPQVYELSRLMNLTTYQDLFKFASERRDKGVERWMPVLYTTADPDGGMLSLMPGDDMYPQEPDLLGNDSSKDLSVTLNDLKAQVKNQHHVEMKGMLSRVFCNVKLPCGHLRPLTYRNPKPAVQSYL